VQRSVSSLAPATIDEALPAIPAAPAPSPTGASRYRKLRSHARGGLGEVSVALDEEFGREVALKEIQAQHADRADLRARFLREAAITGNLEHPGIVPVYSLGQYPDGSLYYTMRLIHGESLHDAIKRFHHADQTRRDPGERELSLRGLLRRFIDVCNAAGYAHSRGVIHRDIKPSNVMLGEYGETLLVDWGLAKVVNQPEGATVVARPVPPGADSTQTAPDLAVGTPAFMPPEQARGEHDRLDERCDVWALGATLYCLLTGYAPYAGPLAREQAANAAFSPARQVNRRVPAPLEAVCQTAMALRPEARYGSARALAADIERWLADEPVNAYQGWWQMVWSC
jgi:serine/threonine protein kinase